nr:hypothetical protein Q903MT_gene1169 [Picea sitchensis]
MYSIGNESKVGRSFIKDDHRGFIQIHTVKYDEMPERKLSSMSHRKEEWGNGDSNY